MQSRGQLTTGVGERQRFCQCFLFALAILDSCSGCDTSSLRQTGLQGHGRSFPREFSGSLCPDSQLFGNRILGRIRSFPVFEGIKGDGCVGRMDGEVECAEDTLDFVD